MHWLITGGCGFIGTSLIERLLKDDPQVQITVLDNLLVGTKENLQEVCKFYEDLNNGRAESSSIKADAQVRLIVGDIKKYETCLRSTRGVNIVAHLAASTGVAPSVENARADFEANVLGTFNMLEAAQQNKVERFVFASSGAPLGDVEPPIHEEKAPKPVSPYGAGKLAGEGYSSAYARTFGLKTVALRFGNVYGPRSGHKQSVVAKFIKLALAGEPLEIYGDGQQTRDFIFIEDLVAAIVKTTCCDVAGEVFQIASHRETTINEVADRLKKIIDPMKVSAPLQIPHGLPRPGEVRRNVSDIQKARRILGWWPKVRLEDGLRVTVEWFLANHKQEDQKGSCV